MFFLVCVYLVVICVTRMGVAMPKYFNVPLRSDIVSLDPTKQDDLFSFHIILQMYESLFGYNDSGDIIPILVDDWKVINEKEYIFILKKGVLFHNQEELTSDDVIASFEKVLSKDSVNWWALSQIVGAMDFRNGKTKSVSGLQKIDKYTIRVRLTEAFAPFMKILTCQAYVPIMPASLIRSNHNFEKWPVGTGPYFIKEYDHESEVVLSSFNQYHGGRPVVKNVRVLTAVKNPVELFNERKLDYVPIFNKKDEAKVKYSGEPHDNIYQYGTWFMTFNLGDKSIHPNIRKAFYYGIDKAVLASKQPDYVDVTDSFIPNGLLGSRIDRFKNHYNLAKAKTLISVLPQEKRHLEIAFPEKLAHFPDAMTLIKDSCKSVGLNCTYKVLSMKDMMGLIGRAAYQAIVMQVTPGYRDTDAMIYPGFFSGSHLPLTNSRDPIIDDFLQKARITFDNKARSNYYMQLDDYMCSNAFVIPLYSERAKLFFADGFDGFNAHGMNIYDMQFKFVK